MLTALIVYCIISTIMMACIIIPDKTCKFDNIAEEIVSEGICILLGPIIIAIAIGWMIVESIGDFTVNRKKVKEVQLKSYEELSKGTQKRLTNCMNRYFEYFGRT
jgi:hypothetical protein